MALPNTIAGTIGRFRQTGAELESYKSGDGVRVLDVDGQQAELTGSTSTVTGRASTVIEDTEPHVGISGTHIDIGRDEFDRRIGTAFAARGRTVFAESTVEEGGGTFPFTLLSAVSHVKCERLNFDTDAIREAWEADGSLSETWMAGSADGDHGTVIAYGEASTDARSDIGLGFERAWEGYVLRGVVFASGYVAVYEDLSDSAFLRFVTGELVPHGFVPNEDADEKQTTFKDQVGDFLDDEGYDVERGGG